MPGLPRCAAPCSRTAARSVPASADSPLTMSMKMSSSVGRRSSRRDGGIAAATACITAPRLRRRRHHQLPGVAVLLDALDARYRRERPDVRRRVQRLEQDAARREPRLDVAQGVVEHLHALVDHHDVVAQLLGVDHHVRREEDRGAARVLFEHQVAQQPLVHRVEAAERLVEDDERRAVDDRREELHLLLHALRELFAALVRDAAEVDPVEPLLDARLEIQPVVALEARHVGEELADAHALVEAALLRQVADLVLGLHRRSMPEHGELSAIGHLDREDHPDGGGLAGAVRADHPVERALRHDEVEVPDGDGVAERLGQSLENNGVCMSVEPHLRRPRAAAPAAAPICSA